MKKMLQDKIHRTKDRMWKELCVDLKRDTWGLAYKIMHEKFKSHTSVSVSDGEKMKTAKELLPARSRINLCYPEIEMVEMNPFTQEEIR